METDLRTFPLLIQVAPWDCPYCGHSHNTCPRCELCYLRPLEAQRIHEQLLVARARRRYKIEVGSWIGSFFGSITGMLITNRAVVGAGCGVVTGLLFGKAVNWLTKDDTSIAAMALRLRVTLQIPPEERTQLFIQLQLRTRRNLIVDGFPTYQFESGPEDSESIVCSVCLEAFCDGDEIRVLNACDHQFHTTCVDRWLIQRGSCPLCRRSLLAVVANGD